MASIYCPQCGTPNDAPSTFCGNCGYTLQATDAATSRSPQGQPGSTHLPPPPPPYAGGNTPSSATYPAGGTPPPAYPIGHTPSAPTYPAGGTPPPSYPASGTGAFPTHPAGGTPPYPGGNTPSSANYPAGGTPPPPVFYPKGDENLPPQKPQQRRKGKGGLIAVLVIVLIVILAGGGAGAYFYLSHNASPKTTGSTSTPGVTATTAPTQIPTATTAPTQNPTLTVTAGPTSTASSSTPSTTPTTSGSPLNSYSATQPGPGCDSNGGTWTPQNLSNITCGTQISVDSNNSRGYLYLQLPSNQPFAASNTIGVTGAFNGYSNLNCVGLAELSASAGYLVEFCNNGAWYIYSISSTGAVVKTLANSITSTRNSTQISLSLKGTTLTFTIDSEVHTLTVSALQPTKVGITYFADPGESITITNFSYITPAS